MMEIPQTYLEKAQGFFEIVHAFKGISIPYFLDKAWLMGDIQSPRYEELIDMSPVEADVDSILHFIKTLTPKELAILVFHRVEPAKAKERIYDDTPTFAQEDQTQGENEQEASN